MVEMKKISTKLPEVYIIEPQVFGDQRGWFMETWSEEKCKKLGINKLFVQDNHSYTAKKGTLRGLHFQNNPMAQCKIVRCIAGAVKDVAVDIRKGSPNYLKWVAVELTAENKLQLFIPRGFAHGFLTLTDNVEFVYKVDNLYSMECDRSIRFDDPNIGVDWGISNPVLSEKDLNAPLLSNSDCNFVYETNGGER
jgi:dTDP-4-dehydrorhamnose 3,5-epimerase